MRGAAILLGLLLSAGLRAGAPASNQEKTNPGNLTVMLLGTARGPTLLPQRLGISTLIVAGSERLLFDCGQGAPTAMGRLPPNQPTSPRYF